MKVMLVNDLFSHFSGLEDLMVLYAAMNKLEELWRY